VHVEPFDPATADEATAAAFAEHLAAALVTSTPRGEREPAAHLLNRIRHRGRLHRLRYWVARDGDEILGSGEAEWWETPDNRNRASFNVDVLPERYSDGLADALGRAAATALREAGRPLLAVFAAPGEPLGSYYTARGAKPGKVNLLNVARLASLDPADLAMLAQVPDGYELVTFDGPCPDDLIDAYTRLVSTMNDAPRGDLTMEDRVYTPDRVRDFERGIADRGHTLWTVCARATGSAGLAAYTNLVIAPDWPEVVHQEDTAVAVPHRGHGLGLTVKAANLLRLRTERPRARCVSTWNTASNEHMLRVNRRLGFGCEATFVAYEIDAGQLLAARYPLARHPARE
jgi:GNAT superfamily N-acetyltransferase